MSSSRNIKFDRDGTEEEEGGPCCTSLTVWRKSLLFSCNGFTVIDSDGNLAYRVDNYAGRPDEVILMDASGKSLLTLCRRKKLRLASGHWLVYEGEGADHGGRRGDQECLSNKKPLCCVRKKQVMMMNGILRQSNKNNINKNNTNIKILARIYRGISDKRYAYVIEGSYSNRSCRVIDESRKVVAEIKKKEAVVGGVSFGLEVFRLIVWPGFDAAFAMAVVLLLDQMFA